jgi:hypothetical protein
LFESGFEIFDDFLGEHVGIGEIVGVFEASVSEPEDIKAGFVAVDEFVVIVCAPAAGGICDRLFGLLDCFAHKILSTFSVTYYLCIPRNPVGSGSVSPSKTF